MVVAVPAKPEVAPETAKNTESPAEPLTREEVGALDTIQGVVLKSPLGVATWESVEPRSPINAQTRLINLAPFRNQIKSGSGEVGMVDSTEVVFNHPEKDEASEFELREGRVVVQAVSGRPLPYNVRFEGRVLAVTPDPGHTVGLERIHSFVEGTSEPSPPPPPPLCSGR